jgi:predicted nucleic acid-binding protein
MNLNLFVDTNVWSLALRRDAPQRTPEVDTLAEQLTAGAPVFTTGLVLQELLQGFTGPKAQTNIIQRFSALPFLVPDRTDHIKAAELRNKCSRKGVQVGTIDALLAQLCIRHKLVLLTSDRDFAAVARHSTLTIWH